MCVIGVVLIGLLSVLHQFVVTRPTRQAREASTREFELSNAIGRNADAVHAMGMAPGLTRLWFHYRGDAIRAQRVAQDRAGIILGCIALLRQSEFFVVYAIGALLYIEREIGAGTLMAAAFIGLRAIGPIEQVVSGWRTIVGARDAYQRLAQLFAASDSGENMDLPPPEGRLTLAHVYAAAPGATSAHPQGCLVCVACGAGARRGRAERRRQVVAVRSSWSAPGSRSYGTVRLDEPAISRTGTPTSWAVHRLCAAGDRALAGHRGREHRPLRRPARGADDEAVLAAARLAGVEELIRYLPDGYNTRVGPGGQVLSAASASASRWPARSTATVRHRARRAQLQSRRAGRGSARPRA